jgi:hypothetical protein
MDAINSLDNSEKLYILNTLKDANVPFTKNSNGYFFNVTNINKNVKQDVIRKIDYIKKNRDIIKNADYQREKYMNDFKNRIDDIQQDKTNKEIQDFIQAVTLRQDSNIVLDTETTLEPCKDPDILMSDYVIKKNKVFKNHPLYPYLKNKKIHNDYNEHTELKEIGIDYNYECESDNEYDNECIENDSFIINQEVSEDIEDKESEINDIDPYTLKLYMDFYREILIERGYKFKNSSHDLLLIQEYL